MNKCVCVQQMQEHASNDVLLHFIEYICTKIRNIRHIQLNPKKSDNFYCPLQQ